MGTRKLRTRRTKNKSNSTIVKTKLSYDDLMSETIKYKKSPRLKISDDIKKFIIDAREKKHISYENISEILTKNGFKCGRDFVRNCYKKTKGD